MENGIGPVVVKNVGRNAEINVERCSAIALQLVGGGVIPQGNLLVSARPARRAIGRLPFRKLERIDPGLRPGKHVAVQSHGLGRNYQLVRGPAGHDQQLAVWIRRIGAHGHRGSIHGGQPEASGQA